MKPVSKVISILLAALSCWHTVAMVVVAQRAQFSDFYEVQPTPSFTQPGSQPAMFQGPLTAPGGFQGAPQIINNQPASGFVQGPNIVTSPVFDPYNSNSSPLPTLPGNGIATQNPYQGYTLSNPPPALNFGTPSDFPQVSVDAFGNGSQASGIGQANSNPFSNNTSAWPPQSWSQLRTQWLPKLVEHPRFRHLWISGNNGNELGLNETEVATTLTWPSFLRSNQPLLISPGFIIDFWDGPDTAVTGFDLPAVTYAPYLSFEASSDLKKNVGLETSVTLGVYSDFRNVNSDSLRITGTGLLWVDVNPYTRFKAGVEYFDRINVKILPAFGFFMQPNSEMKLDLYFPRPRVSHRLPKRGNFDTWAYAGGEYGGGSWTIQRMGGANDQVDINDVRAFVGLEWTGPKNVTGFLETGYVFERGMLYRSDPLTQLQIQDAWMVRGGFSF